MRMKLRVKKLPIERLWWVGAAAAAALVAICLPRLVPGSDSEPQPYQRSAEHAEV